MSSTRPRPRRSLAGRAVGSVPGVLLAAVVGAPCLGLHPLAAQASSDAGRPTLPLTLESPAVTDHLARGDRLDAALRPLDAYRAYRSAAEQADDAYEALWKASRTAFTLGVLADGEEARREWIALSESHARAALEADSGGVEAHEWLTAALGRRTEWEGPQGKVRLAEEIRMAARRALELDPEHPGAHHAMGQWHAAIARLDGMTRFAARTVLGADSFGDASWEDAERHLRRSVQLDPGSVLFRVELARLLVDRGRPDEARPHLEAALARPPGRATDPLLQDQARDLLADLS